MLNDAKPRTTAFVVPQHGTRPFLNMQPFLSSVNSVQLVAPTLETPVLPLEPERKEAYIPVALARTQLSKVVDDMHTMKAEQVRKVQEMLDQYHEIERETRKRYEARVRALKTRAETKLQEANEQYLALETRMVVSDELHGIEKQILEDKVESLELDHVVIEEKKRSEFERALLAYEDALTREQTRARKELARVAEATAVAGKEALKQLRNEVEMSSEEVCGFLLRMGEELQHVKTSLKTQQDQYRDREVNFRRNWTTRARVERVVYDLIDGIVEQKHELKQAAQVQHLEATLEQFKVQVIALTSREELLERRLQGLKQWRERMQAQAVHETIDLLVNAVAQRIEDTPCAAFDALTQTEETLASTASIYTEEEGSNVLVPALDLDNLKYESDNESSRVFRDQGSSAREEPRIVMNDVSTEAIVSTRESGTEALDDGVIALEQEVQELRTQLANVNTFHQPEHIEDKKTGEEVADPNAMLVDETIENKTNKQLDDHLQQQQVALEEELTTISREVNERRAEKTRLESEIEQLRLYLELTEERESQVIVATSQAKGNTDRVIDDVKGGEELETNEWKEEQEEEKEEEEKEEEEEEEELKRGLADSKEDEKEIFVVQEEAFTVTEDAARCLHLMQLIDDAVVCGKAQFNRGEKGKCFQTYTKCADQCVTELLGFHEKARQEDAIGLKRVLKDAARLPVARKPLTLRKELDSVRAKCEKWLQAREEQATAARKEATVQEQKQKKKKTTEKTKHHQIKAEEKEEKKGKTSHKKPNATDNGGKKEFLVGRRVVEDETATLRQELALANRKVTDLSELELQVSTLQEQAALLKPLSKELGDVKASYATLETRYREEQALRKKYYNQIEDMKGKIRVYARCRPMNRAEMERGCTSCVELKDEMSLEVTGGTRGAKSFVYDQVFGPQSTQAQVFEDTKPLLQSALDGYNVCIFAYGQTGSGKTFTMTGSASEPGLSRRAIQQLFALASESQGQSQVRFYATMLELYNDTLIDLLHLVEGGGAEPKLEIKKTEKGMVVVQNAVRKECWSSDETLRLFDAANKKRQVGATKMNAESSRSHSIFSLLVESLNETTKATTMGKLSLVDLAGSERAGKTGATAERMKEAQAINKSLSALGDVISALSTNEKFIPYRNNKLTQLMQDSLGGNAKTLMLVNISPADYNQEETVTSLTYASRVKLITNNANKNSESEQVNRLKAIIKQLRAGKMDVDVEGIMV